MAATFASGRNRTSGADAASQSVADQPALVKVLGNEHHAEQGVRRGLEGGRALDIAVDKAPCGKCTVKLHFYSIGRPIRVIGGNLKNPIMRIIDKGAAKAPQSRMDSTFYVPPSVFLTPYFQFNETDNSVSR